MNKAMPGNDGKKCPYWAGRHTKCSANYVSDLKILRQSHSKILNMFWKQQISAWKLGSVGRNVGKCVWNRQVMTWTNSESLPNGPLGTNLTQNLHEDKCFLAGKRIWKCLQDVGLLPRSQLVNSTCCLVYPNGRIMGTTTSWHKDVALVTFFTYFESAILVLSSF